MYHLMDDSRLGDPDRLQALARSKMMDSGAEEVFERLARLATRLLGTPIALMSVIDGHHQYVKGSYGLELLPPRMPAAASFCQYVVRDRAPFTVTDARDEPRVGDATTQAAADAGVIAYCGVPLADPDGPAIGALCTMDTSPRAWTEEEVQMLDELAASAMTEVRLRVADHARRAVERRQRRLLDEISDTMVILYDTSGRCVLMQGGLTAAVGIDGEAQVGKLIDDQVSSAEAHGLPGLVRRALAGEPSTIDYDAGRGRHYEIGFAPYCEEDGTITGALTVWREVTTRVQREADNRMLAAMVQQSEDAIIAEDRDGKILEWNQGAKRLYGYARDEAIGTSVEMIVPEARAGEDRRLLGRALSGESVQLDTVRVGKDGRTVDVSIRISPLMDGVGTVTGASVISRDISDRKRLEDQLRHLADHDALTGLFNRRAFEAELTRSVASTDRYAQEGALLLIDLDGFKRVNDTLGHSYGDELITRVAACLRRCLRETDVIGRLGGDEFAVILPRADATAATTAAERVLHAVAEHATVGSDDRRTSVTASIGVAALTPGAGVDAEALLVSADTAMYAAKQLGRNQIAFAAPGDTGPRTLTSERSWLGRLRAALDHDRLELFAQPIRAICGPPVDRFELLLRMHGEAGELIMPATFLPIAERFDLIQEIDRWVFAQALTLLANCHATGRDVSLGVNMSGRTLCDPRLIDDLSAMIAACPIPSGRLIVEITETAAIVNLDRARDVAQALRALGCRFALDDFGSGFASLSYLKHLQFDFVKIDGEFVRGLAEDGADRLIVASIVGLAHRLGAETIAEFIEDEATVTRLRRLGVDHGQGYHLGRPAPVTEVLPEGQSPARSLTIESSRSATSATIRSPTASSASL